MSRLLWVAISGVVGLSFYGVTERLKVDDKVPCEAVVTNYCQIVVVNEGDVLGIYRNDYEKSSCPSRHERVFSDRLSLQTDRVTLEFWQAFFPKCQVIN